MNTTMLALWAITVGFSMWVIAGLWHNLILTKFYTHETEATHKGIGILLIAYLILGRM